VAGEEGISSRHSAFGHSRTAKTWAELAAVHEDFKPTVSFADC
jgi:hypothetical protein